MTSQASYEEMLNEAVSIFQEKMKEDPEDATAKLAAQLGGSEADAAFAREMGLLRTNINMLNNLFATVETNLASFDAEELADKEGKVTKFEPLWAEIRQKFDNTLLKSRTFAGTLAHRVEMYFDSILPMLGKSNVSKKEKLESLAYFLGENVEADNYNEKLQKDEKAAAEIATEFEAVQTQVNGFRSRFEAYYLKAVDALAAKVTEVKGKIKVLEAELDGYKAHRNVLIGVAGAGVLATTVGGVMLATGVLAPVAIGLVVIGAVAALGGGLAAGYFQIKMAETQSQLDSARVELQQVINKQEHANTIAKDLVAQTDADIQNILSKMGAFGQIWNYIRDDAQTARLQLEEATEDVIPILLREVSIAKSTVAYKQLYSVVKLYSQGFDESKV
jgi:hypothetical protein